MTIIYDYSIVVARKRMIDPHIWEDPSFNNLSFGGRLLFIGMISNADDEGFLRGDKGSLKRLIFGFDEISKEQMDEFLVELSNMKTLHFYVNEGEQYVHLVKWSEYQKQRDDRIQASVYPKCVTCQTDGGHLPAEVKLSKVKLSKEEVNIYAADSSKKRNNLILSKSQQMAFLKEFPGLTSTELNEEIDKCNSYMAMSSVVYSNHGLFFRGWLKKRMEEKRAVKLAAEKKLKLDQITEEDTRTPEEIEKANQRLAEIRANLARKTKMP